MTSIMPEFQVKMSQKYWPCVLDPTLAFSRYGLMLTKRLGKVLELWLGRELWHILDNTHYYLQDSDTLFNASGQTEQQWQQLSAILQEWERLRLANDPANQYCYWLGDSPLESFLPDQQEPDTLWRYEKMAHRLENRIPSYFNDTLNLAYRDVLALTATLESAFILTHVPEKSAPNTQPDLCHVLTKCHIPCQQVAKDHPLLLMECNQLRQIFVQAGLAKLFWTELQLAVLQLVVPGATAVSQLEGEHLMYSDATGPLGMAPPSSEIDPWQGAQGFWYVL